MRMSTSITGFVSASGVLGVRLSWIRVDGMFIGCLFSSCASLFGHLFECDATKRTV